MKRAKPIKFTSMDVSAMLDLFNWPEAGIGYNIRIIYHLILDGRREVKLTKRSKEGYTILFKGTDWPRSLVLSPRK